MYPEGDRAVPPSGHMPAGGYYFDTIIRQEPIDDARLNPEDNLEEFGPISDDDLAYLADEADRLYEETDKAILANFGGTAFGDIALVPGPWMKHPKGIRDVAEWYMSTVSRRDYVWQVFERQCEIGLANLRTHPRRRGRAGGGGVRHRHRLRHAARPIHLAQGLSRSFHAVPPGRERLDPREHDLEDLHPLVRLGVRAHAGLHRGRVRHPEPGADVGGAHGPAGAQSAFRRAITFWGGGVDTQRTLPFGTPDEVRAEVRERMRIFGAGGGFVFNTIHNVQARVPAENLLALYEAVKM